jgi:hypothetical protein
MCASLGGRLYAVRNVTPSGVSLIVPEYAAQRPGARRWRAAVELSVWAWSVEDRADVVVG